LDLFFRGVLLFPSFSALFHTNSTQEKKKKTLGNSSKSKNMSPSLVSVTPPEGVKTAELTASAVAQKIEIASHLQPLDASKLKFTKTSTPMAVPEPGDPIIDTASQCTDHMITAVWKSTTGWEAPELRPYGTLSIAPTASVLHYATECFEGLRMYRGYDGRLRLFRPDCNCKRMVSKLAIYPDI
jgi:branched-chain amino acid aminotransferase